MFLFEKEQFVYDIAGTRVGGHPGEHPTVLAGTIFYGGHKIVKDPVRGDFDKKAAESLINSQEELSDTTGNPRMVQVFAETSEAMLKFLGFTADLSDAPFLIDSADPLVRVSGLHYAEEVGFLDRAIYNSLNVSATKEEREALWNMQHECAIILAFNPQDPSIAGKRGVLDDGTITLERGLLALAEDLGIKKPLIDTATMAMGAGAGSSASFTFVAKTLYGHPVGAGIHNAPSSWSWLRKIRKESPEVFEACDIASNLITHTLGADFILYGPIENAERVFPVVAMADIFAAESLRTEFGIEPIEGHPINKLL
ncbi:MAG: tetrahydromethanopterin S-methyltransferase subunit H [Candidatus Thorarchaeota archaeon]|nr:MAG: tetrahydromethanopterin S-methyltransferase subunit H [Candidatus Thorarchaeota archaeon]